MTATIFAAAPAAEPIIPTSYTIRVTVTRCNSCNAVSRQSEFLAMTMVKPRMGQGNPVRHWTECLSLLPLPPAPSGLTVLPDVVLKGQPAKQKAAPAAKPRIEDLA